MLTSSGTTAIIKFFLTWVRDASPSVRPGVIMTDRDQAQIAALEIVYPQSRVFLCTWHVLRAIRGHFVTTQFEALWEKIKAWVITEETAVFYNIWDEISSDPSVPQSMIKYLATEWLPVLHMWSRISRKDRSIFEEGNTNMLIEAYVFDSIFFAIIKLIKSQISSCIENPSAWWEAQSAR
jgi:MULE transposase domain